MNNTKIPEVTPEDVKEASEKATGETILDVRTAQEFSKAHIQGSILLPLDDLINKVTSVIPNKQDVIYVYCLSGSRSIIAVQQMIALGYTHVYNLSNGLLAWRLKGFPLSNT